MFSYGELRKHERTGDDTPGAVDQSGFKGHPECGFCKERFYGDDELYTHCREKHERCHICDRRNNGRNPQYYLNYQELEKHFAAEHYVCFDPECQANKTNVFESEMDLKAHQLAEHAGAQSKDIRRDARLVNLSGFDLRSPYQPERGRGRDRRGGQGRGRDPNAEPLPMSSAQPLSRAELAYQRQMAIQTSQSITPRTFGGQLTQTAPSPRPQPAQPVRPQTQTADPPSLDTLNISANASPQDRARALRHQAVTERATNLLGNDPTKLSQFRTNVSSYRSSTITATDLIDAFFSLFDCSASELGILVRELADLYENAEKRTSLLEAWNNWRSINEDYPSLPLPSGAAPADGGSLGANFSSGRRVLKLKSSTQQSSRSSTARQASWGNVLSPPMGARGGLSSRPLPAEAFPSLPSSSASRKPPASSIGWAGAASNPSATNASTTSSSRKPATATPARNEELFPSLPTSSKPLNTMISGFNTRAYGPSLSRSNNASGRNSGVATPANVWANGGGMAPTPAQAAAAVNDAFGSGGDADDGDDGVFGGNGGGGGKKVKGKGKGKGKGDVLFHFG